MQEIYQQPRIDNDKYLMKTEYPSQKQSFKSNYSNYAGDHNKKVDDGYKWRKYGQKNVKASENPRSYYKCTYQNCLVRKIVETSSNGDITEIVYKGNHNHPKPQSTKRSSNSTASSSSHLVHQSNDFLNQYNGSGQWELIGTPENSSVSIEDDEFFEDEAQAKRM